MFRLDTKEKHDAVKKQFATGKISRPQRTLLNKDRPHIYKVIVGETLDAVFKETGKDDRDVIAQNNEIIAYELAVNLFGSLYIVPPTARATFSGADGILQYYVPGLTVCEKIIFAKGREHFFSSSENPSAQHILSENFAHSISRDSYAEFQIFKYIIGINDFHFGNIIFWKKPDSEQYHITSIDNEKLKQPSEKFGKTNWGKVDIYNTDMHAGFESWYSSTFPHPLIDRIKLITAEQVWALFKKNNCISEGTETYITNLMANCASVLEWVGSKQNRANAVSNMFFRNNSNPPAQSAEIINLVSAYDFRQ